MSTLGTFSTFDYLILGLMLSISVLIGIYHAFSGGRQSTTEEFLLADKSLHPLASALSVVASVLSGITMLGTPAEMYLYGTMYWFYCFAFIISGIVVGCVFVPVFVRLELTSINEYLELRFDSVAVRMCGLLVYSMYTMTYLGLVIYAPALTLSTVTGINLWGSILATGIVCTFYTAIGGMKAVIWTDVFQVTVMMIAFIAVIIECNRRLDGIGNVWNIAKEGGRMTSFDFRVDPTIRHTFWTVVIGGSFSWVAVLGVSQSQMQKYLSCGTVKKAETAVILSVMGTITMTSLALLAGVYMYAYYAECDPLRRGLIEKPEQIIVYLIMDIFAQTPGLPGLFTSGVFSAALSTLSSSLNALVALTTEDLIRPFRKAFTDSQLTVVGKVLVLVYGGIVIFLAFIASLLTSEILQLANTLMGIFLGPLLGLFCLGILLPWANSKGAIIGLIAGIIITTWIGIGAAIYPPNTNELPLSIDGCMLNETTVIPNTDVTGHESPLKLYSLSYAWYGGVGWSITVVVGLIVSLLTGATNRNDVSPELLCIFWSTGCCRSKSNNVTSYSKHEDEQETLPLDDKNISRYKSNEDSTDMN